MNFGIIGVVKMGAIWRGCKRYFLEYESDRIICGSNIHHGYEANSVKTLKAAIKQVRKKEAQHKPRNFIIFDVFGECEPGEHVPAVYKET